MEETKNEKCGICSALSKCCCTKHKIIHILIWVLVGLAIFCAGISIGARMGHFRGSPENFGRFENKMGCQNNGCPMMQGMRNNDGFNKNRINVVKPLDTVSTTATGTIE